MAPPLVVMPHTELGICSRAWVALHRQNEDALTALTPARDPFSYARILRRLWREPGELIICEGDVVAPPGSIERLANCPAPWCTHPHWVGDHHDLHTFGLVHFSERLRQGYPALMDWLVSRPDSRHWVRMGWTGLPRDCSVETLNGPGRRAALRPSAPVIATSPNPRVRPTSQGWIGIDTAFARAMDELGVRVHVHQRETEHLHDYRRRPPGSDRHWHQCAYEEHDWPTG